MVYAKPGHLPMLHNTTLSKSRYLKRQVEREKMDEITYASLIVSIMCAIIFTKSNVSYALSATIKHHPDTGEAH